MCDNPNILIILFSLILHLNKEPYWKLVSHSSLAKISYLSDLSEYLDKPNLGLLHLQALTLAGPTRDKPGTRPPSCTTPRQLTIHFGGSKHVVYSMLAHCCLTWLATFLQAHPRTEASVWKFRGQSSVLWRVDGCHHLTFWNTSRRISRASILHRLLAGVERTGTSGLAQAWSIQVASPVTLVSLPSMIGRRRMPNLKISKQGTISVLSFLVIIFNKR